MSQSTLSRWLRLRPPRRVGGMEDERMAKKRPKLPNRTTTPRKPGTTRKSAPPDWAGRWYAALEETRSVTNACKTVGIARRTAYDRRDRDEEFRRRWDDIIAQQVDDLVDSAMKRATLGVRRPVLFQGEIVKDPETGERLEYVDYPEATTIFLMQARAGLKRDDPEHERVDTGPPTIILHTGPGAKVEIPEE